MSTGHELWDPGAQPERTYQAWVRTGLALAACALLATRLAPDAVVGALSVSLAGAVAALAIVHRQKRRLRAECREASPGSVLGMTVLVVALAGAAAVLAVAR